MDKKIEALLVVAKFEAGQVDLTRWQRNVSPQMIGALRRAGLVDRSGQLTELGWEVEGMHPVPADGGPFFANALVHTGV